MQSSKKTLVIGASANPERFAFKAIYSLRERGHEVVAWGLRAGQVADVVIDTENKNVENIDTVSLYVGPKNQPAYYEQILALQPKRIIFNPGTENPAFEEMAEERGIEALEACTLVMLSVGNY